MIRRQTILVLVASAVVVSLAGTFATREFLRARLAVQKLEKLRREFAQWQRKVVELEAAPRDRVHATSDKSDQLNPSAHAPTRENSRESPSADALAAMHLQALEAEAQLNFDRFFRARGLASAQASAVTHRVAELNRSTLELSTKATSEARGDPSHPAAIAFAKARDEANARFEADMTALLGREGYEEYQRFQRTLPHWSHVTTLATHLFRTETPLQPVQAMQLAQIIIANATNPQGVITRTPSNWNLVFSQAGAILSPSQLEMFTALKERSDLHQQLNRMIIRSKSGR